MCFVTGQRRFQQTSRTFVDKCRPEPTTIRLLQRAPPHTSLSAGGTHQFQPPSLAPDPLFDRGVVQTDQAPDFLVDPDDCRPRQLGVQNDLVEPLSLGVEEQRL